MIDQLDYKFAMSKYKSGGLSFLKTASSYSTDRVGIQQKYNEEKMAKMYAYPANIAQAQQHRYANRFGYNSKFQRNHKQINLCPCCELPINNTMIQLAYPTTPHEDQIKVGERKYKLNAGTSLLFTFIKMTIAYLFLRFAITDGYNLITNILAENCKNPKNVEDCRNNVAAKFSNYNKNTDTDQTHVFIVDILNIVTVFASMVFFTYYRKYQLEIFQLASTSNHSEADYTIFVEQIPIILQKQSGINYSTLVDNDYKTGLIKTFSDEIGLWFKDNKQKISANQSKQKGLMQKIDQLQHSICDGIIQNANIEPIVTSVTLCFDLTQMNNLNNQRQEIMQKHKYTQDSEQKDTYQNYYLSQVEGLNRQTIQLSRKYAQSKNSQFYHSNFLGKAFVSFQYLHYKQIILEYLKKDVIFHGTDKQLQISYAAQPSDVYWQNMAVPQWLRVVSIFCSYLGMLLLLSFSFGLLLFFQYLKIQSKQRNSSTFSSYVFTFIMTVITMAINYALGLAIEKFTKCQRHMTKTDQIISLIVKTVIAQFLNTAIIYYIISLIADIFFLNDIKSSLGDNGLIMNITSLIAVSGVIQVFTNFVQFWEQYKDLKSQFKYANEDTANLFQVELNKELQPSEFSFAVRYSYYILNVFVVSFYSYIVPYTSLILIVIFALQYWVDKFNLFNRFSCPTAFNYRLSMFTLKIFECSIFFFALGNLLFAPIIHTNSRGGEYKVINIVSFTLALVYCLLIYLLPKRVLQTLLIDFNNFSYSQCMVKSHFNKVYQRQNPATTFAASFYQLSKSIYKQYARHTRSKLGDVSDLNNISKLSPQEQVYLPQDFKQEAQSSKDEQPLC